MISKMSINNKSEIPDAMAVQLVSRVMAAGRISDDNRTYCRATRFSEGFYYVIVYASRTPAGNDTFTIVDDNGK